MCAGVDLPHDFAVSGLVSGKVLNTNCLILCVCVC